MWLSEAVRTIAHLGLCGENGGNFHLILWLGG